MVVCTALEQDHRICKSTHRCDHHRFARGDAVLLSTQDGSLATPESKGDATVARIVGNQAVSSDDEDVLEGDGYRLVMNSLCVFHAFSNADIC